MLFLRDWKLITNSNNERSDLPGTSVLLYYQKVTSNQCFLLNKIMYRYDVLDEIKLVFVALLYVFYIHT